MTQEDARQFRHVGIDYVCQNPESHMHFSKSRVDREHAIGVMKYAGKHKRVAYFVEIASLEVCGPKGTVPTVQRVRGNSLLNIKKAR